MISGDVVTTVKAYLADGRKLRKQLKNKIKEKNQILETRISQKRIPNNSNNNKRRNGYTTYQTLY